MQGMHELLERWNPAERERLVVATLMSAQGHSYRKPGAVMLFDRHGPAAGSLSPGCMEADLAVHAASVLDSGASLTAVYDMTTGDDPLWGETSFCGGSVSVLLEALDGYLRDALIQMRYWLSYGYQVELVRILDNKGRVQAYRLNREGGTSRRFGRVERSFWTWSARYAPKPRLVIFGYGPDSYPVAELAARSGFQVIAADWRGQEEDAMVPVGCRRITAPLSSLLEETALLPGDRVLLMSHQYRQERELLERLLPLPVLYIGILGSKARTARLLEEVGVTAKPDSRIHGPVGLAIGASGGEQIAVSIVAELILDLSREKAEVIRQPQEWRSSRRSRTLLSNVH
jgi:xanthine dehydrogenase accessory factor